MQVTQTQPSINSTKPVTLVHSRRPTYRYHPTVWVLWLLAALTPAMLTQNPFYLLLIILMVTFCSFPHAPLSCLATSARRPA